MFQAHYDDERDEIVFHITPDLQDHDHSEQDQDRDQFFGLRPVLS